MFNTVQDRNVIFLLAYHIAVANMFSTHRLEVLAIRRFDRLKECVRVTGANTLHIKRAYIIAKSLSGLGLGELYKTLLIVPDATRYTEYLIASAPATARQ